MVKGQGRQKIELKKLENAGNLQVTFSKRRLGLFKKASELSTLCGTEILMLVGSPGGKFYSFGHPSVEDLIDRFFSLGHDTVIPRQQNSNQPLVQSRPDRDIQYLNELLTHVLANEKEEKDRKKKLEKIIKDKTNDEKDLKELDQNETDNLMSTLQNLKKNWVREMSQYYSQVNASQNYLGESSGCIGGRNVDVGTDIFDQRRNTFNYNPNMIFPNNTPLFGYNTDPTPMFGYNNDHTPLFVYNNDGVIVPRANNDGVYVPSYNSAGIIVPGANNDEVYVPSYNNDGVIVPRANTDGVYIPSYNNDGVVVPRSNTDGVYIPSYNNDGVVVPSYNNDGVVVPSYNNAGGIIPRSNNDGVIVPSYNNDGGIVPGSNNDGVIVPRSNMNDMSSYNFNQN